MQAQGMEKRSMQSGPGTLAAAYWPAQQQIRSCGISVSQMAAVEKTDLQGTQEHAAHGIGESSSCLLLAAVGQGKDADSVQQRVVVCRQEDK